MKKSPLLLLSVMLLLSMLCSCTGNTTPPAVTTEAPNTTSAPTTTLTPITAAPETEPPIVYTGEVIDVPCIADSYVVNGAKSNTNFGREDRMITRQLLTEGYWSVAYVKFDITGIKAEGLGKCTFESYVCGTQDGKVDYMKLLFPVDPDAWEEDTLTWENRPDKLKRLDIGHAGGRYGVPVSIDITKYIKEAIEAGQTVVSFCIEDIRPEWSALATREFKEEQHRPKLVFDYNDPTVYHIFDDYPTPSYGNGIHPLEQAKIVLKESTATYDYATPPTVTTPNKEQYDTQVEAMTFAKKEYVSYPTLLLSSLTDYTPVTEKPALSEYGGDTRRKYDNGTGFFRLEKVDGRWWFIDPDGYLMYAYGKANVRPDDNEAYYATNKITDAASKLTWANQQRDYFKNNLNFNTLGGWSYLFRPLNSKGGFDGSLDLEAITGENNMPFGSIRCYGVSTMYGRLNGTTITGGVDKFEGAVPPVFNPDFAEECEKLVAEYVEGWENNPWIMGWWSDNEINEGLNMLDRALSVDPQDERMSYTHAAAWEWLRERVGRIDAGYADLNDTLREEFREFVYDRYYRIMSGIFKKYCPNHLYLGNRHHDEGKGSLGIMKAAERYCDAYSINLYWEWTPDLLAQWEAMYDMPILITEWYARPVANVNLNGFAGGYICKNSEDCGKFYQHFALRLLEAKNVVGYHFFTAVIGEEQQQYVREFNPNVYDLITYFDEKK